MMKSSAVTTDIIIGYFERRSKMIKKNWSILLITSIVILLPILAGLFLWNQLPEQLPMHWDANGQVDGWGSKTFVVVCMPLIMLAFQWVCVLATMADPKQKDHSEKVLQLVFWIIPLLTLVLFRKEERERYSLFAEDCGRWHR